MICNAAVSTGEGSVAEGPCLSIAGGLVRLYVFPVLYPTMRKKWNQQRHG